MKEKVKNKKKRIFIEDFDWSEVPPPPKRRTKGHVFLSEEINKRKYSFLELCVISDILKELKENCTSKFELCVYEVKLKKIERMIEDGKFYG